MDRPLNSLADDNGNDRNKYGHVLSGDRTTL